MNNNIAIDVVKKMATKVIEMTVDLKLLEKPSRFRKRFKVEETRGETCFGGNRKDSGPFIRVGRKACYLSKESLISVIERTSPTDCRIWKLAEDNWNNLGGLTFVEYASFADDPEIGWFMSNTIEHHCFAMVMHEVAHAVDWWNNPSTKGHQGHGSDWKVLYRALRKKSGYVRSSNGFLVTTPEGCW